MQKVAIITRHNVPNYGSVMQAYATEQILQNLGCNPITVDYRRSDEESNGLIKRHSTGKSPLHMLYRRTVWRLLHFIGERRFKTMRESLLTLSEHCSEADVWEKLPEADVYLTGSDQVWNKLGDGSLDEAFFFSKADISEGQRLISYAASFGCNAVTPGYEERVGRWLGRYDSISVREDSGVEIVEKYDLNATQVLDPTLMLEGATWREMASAGKVPNHPYALVYNLHPDSEMLEYVLDKTKDSGLEVVSVCPTFRRRVGKHVILPTLPEFLGLFAHASCVYTDSFHGTALCINLNIPFVAIFPKENASRNQSILKLVGVEGRAWDVFEGNAWDDSIDWEKVNQVLTNEREHSMKWLNGALNGDCSC